MMVPSLKYLCQTFISDLVVSEESPCLATDLGASLMLMSLDQGAWGFESKFMLDIIVHKYPHRLTPSVVMALLPSSSSSLSLKECPQVTSSCIDDVLKRCTHLQSLDLSSAISSNPKLKINKIKLFKEGNGISHQALTHINLEDCMASDEDIHSLLKNAPQLSHLNIARCNITDKVFLLNEEKQLAREGGFQHPSLKSGYDCRLRSVDVTACKDFTSTGLRHLCTLCGPTLRVLNLSWTKLDSSAFLYLCGMSLPATVHFYLAHEPKEEEGVGSGQSSQRATSKKKNNLNSRRDALMEMLALFDRTVDRIREETEQSIQPDDSTVTSSFTKSSVPSDESLSVGKTIVSNSPERKESNIPATACSGLKNNSNNNVQSPVPVDEKSLQSMSSLLNQPELDCDKQCTSAIVYENSGDNSRNESGQLTTSAGDDTPPLPSPAEESISEETFSPNASAAESQCASSLSDHHCASSSILVDFIKHSSENVSPNLISSPFCLSSHNYEPHSNRNEKETSSCDNVSPALSSQSNICVQNIVSEEFESDEENEIHQRHQIPGHTQHSSTHFTPCLSELCVSGTVFSDLPVSLLLFAEFLRANPSLKTLKIMGGLSGQHVTDCVMEQLTSRIKIDSNVRAHDGTSCDNDGDVAVDGGGGGVAAAALRKLCLEGCVHLSTPGVAGLRVCSQLEHLDLTGVSYIEDIGLTILVKSLPYLKCLLLAETRVKNRTLNTLARLPICQQLEELDLSWCEDIEDDQGLNAIGCACTGLRRLMLREALLSATTLELVAKNCNSITELSIACNLNIVDDNCVITIAEGLPALEAIDLSWNSYLTNDAIHALLTNCTKLRVANLSGMKLITASPFYKLICVPEELINFMKAKRNPGQNPVLRLSELPCLPCRSRTYATHLKELQLVYCDYVEDHKLNEIVAVTMGSIKIIDYYGSELTETDSALENLVVDLYNDLPIEEDSR